MEADKVIDDAIVERRCKGSIATPFRSTFTADTLHGLRKLTSNCFRRSVSCAALNDVRPGMVSNEPPPAPFVSFFRTIYHTKVTSTHTHTHAHAHTRTKQRKAPTAKSISTSYVTPKSNDIRRLLSLVNDVRGQGVLVICPTLNTLLLLYMVGRSVSVRTPAQSSANRHRGHILQ